MTLHTPQPAQQPRRRGGAVVEGGGGGGGGSGGGEAWLLPAPNITILSPSLHQEVKEKEEEEMFKTLNTGRGSVMYRQKPKCIFKIIFLSK